MKNYCNKCGYFYKKKCSCETEAPANPVDCMVVLHDGLSVEEIEKEFGDCDWMRAVFNNWTVDAILFLMSEAKRLKSENDRLQNEVCMNLE